LDVTSSIRAGVLNLTPNPDSIQETSIQSNTYNVDYGRASSIQMLMTTKSGTNQYHGNASDYFTYQGVLARSEFTQTYAPFHSNNISATIGGPMVPGHNIGFFFFAIEPLRASAASPTNVSFEDPQFTAWAQSNFPNTLGTLLLTKYPVSKISNQAVQSTANTLYAGTCGTAATFFLPCNTAMVDTANFSPTSYRNADQYNFRLDKDFKADRLYGSFYRTTLSDNTPNVRSAFGITNQFYQWAVQVNETHTFSPSTLNEAAFAGMRVEGIDGVSGLFSVPLSERASPRATSSSTTITGETSSLIPSSHMTSGWGMKVCSATMSKSSMAPMISRPSSSTGCCNWRPIMSTPKRVFRMIRYPVRGRSTTGMPRVSPTDSSPRTPGRSGTTLP
jgi:hypothetical protein